MENLYLDLKYNKIPPQKGSILISEPYFDDDYFMNTVVLLVEHDDEGSIGFILNKPIISDVGEVTGFLEGFGGKVQIGGPVNMKTIYYMHRLQQPVADSMHIKDGLYWGVNFTDISKLSKQGLLSENDIRFFVGYSGWEAGQLDLEIRNNYWLVSDIKVEEVLADPTTIWQKVLARHKSQYRAWANFPADPNLN